ncbi:MAG: type VI secretion system baseplate subunit TssG [Azoarcus sp.]|nr:type VI secretion system baseplate subunit TssG [Azoarcus sp.]
MEEWMPHWLQLAEENRTVLGVRSAAGQLGRGASVPDRPHRFRIHAGSLRLADYMAFLPGSERLRQLRDWVCNYVGYEFSWDVRLVLRHDEFPPLRLGAATGRLGGDLARTAARQRRPGMPHFGRRAARSAAHALKTTFDNNHRGK